MPLVVAGCLVWVAGTFVYQVAPESLWYFLILGTLLIFLGIAIEEI